MFNSFSRSFCRTKAFRWTRSNKNSPLSQRCWTKSWAIKVHAPKNCFCICRDSDWKRRSRWTMFWSTWEWLMRSMVPRLISPVSSVRTSIRLGLCISKVIHKAFIEVNEQGEWMRLLFLVGRNSRRRAAKLEQNWSNFPSFLRNGSRCGNGRLDEKEMQSLSEKRADRIQSEPSILFFYPRMSTQCDTFFGSMFFA